jgi:NAD(P)-dependent dehydrogenase (short-subunit alcohol dehydrogenase family)
MRDQSVPAVSTILVTGASGRLGTEITRYLVGRGHHVIATSRTKTRLQTLQDETAQLPGRLDVFEADLLGEDAQAIAERLEKHGLIPHALVNNAVDVSNQEVGQTGNPTKQQWRTEFDLAVVVPFELTMALARAKSGRLKKVVNISSMYGVVARHPSLYEDPDRQSPIHYGVAKAAMIHLTKELAVRLAPSGVRVNSISYGGVDGSVDEAFKRRYAALSPAGRMLDKTEVAASIEFLVSDGASSITGHNLIVDGGWTIW